MKIKKTFGGLVSKLVFPVVLAISLLFSNPAKAEQTVPQNYQGDMTQQELAIPSLEELTLRKTSTDPINIYAQPDSGLSHYGCMNQNQDDQLTQEDLDLMNSGTGPTDYADVDADATSFTSNDYTLAFDHINNGTLLPQINWAWPQITRAQREAWLNATLSNIDLTDEISYNNSSDIWERWISGNYSAQLYLYFNKYTGNDIPDKYDSDNICRFDIPVYRANIDFPTSGGHEMNAILLGEDPTDFQDLCMIEPQNDDINVQPGGWNIPYESTIWINKIRKFSWNSSIWNFRIRYISLCIRS